MTRHLATLRALSRMHAFRRIIRLYLRPGSPGEGGERTHRHLVVELHPYRGEDIPRRRVWLRIVHWCIPCAVTTPEVITLVLRPAPFGGAAVAEALGGPRNLTVSQPPIAPQARDGLGGKGDH